MADPRHPIAAAVNQLPMAPMEVSSRAERLQAALAEAEVDALLITNLTNIRYLTGFTGSAAMLLVAPTGLTFVTDGMGFVFDDPIDWYERLSVPMRQGNRIMRFSPINTYQTTDAWAVLGAATPAQWTGVLKAIGRDDLIGDPNWSSLDWRVANDHEVDALLRDWAATRTTSAAVEAMLAAGAIASVIRGPEELAAWPHLQARGMYLPLQHPTLGSLADVGAPGFPLKFGAASAGYDAPAPLPRQHNREIFEELLGLDAAEFARLSDAGVI